MQKVSEASSRIDRTLRLEDPAVTLRFVSGERIRAFERLKIKTIRDLFWHIPRRYIDFTNTCLIGQTPLGLPSTVVGVIDKIVEKTPRPKLKLLEVSIYDESGVMVITFFNQPWLKNQLQIGDTCAFQGKVEFNYGFRRMASPHYEVVAHANEALQNLKIYPVHPTSAGVTPAWMRRIVASALADFGDVCDYLPTHLVRKHSLMSTQAAYAALHFPVSMYERDLARRRLAYDELFLLQITLLKRKHMAESHLKPYVHTPGSHVDQMRASFPFALTDEQNQALSEILGDMTRHQLMNRLLLGDVGTGKTAVAALALAACVDSQTQGCVMAPTGVLATQHYEKLRPLFQKCGITCALLLGSTPQVERKRIAQGLKDGSIDIAFGTTALLNNDLEFKDLSLVVIDEQHRFGVNQRARLRSKGKGADLLSMSATPIPRTLALTVYGDMTVSRIVHRPVEKQPIVTEILTPETENTAWKTISDEIAQGSQVYVVCSVIDNEDFEAQDMVGMTVEEDEESTRKLIPATGMYESLCRQYPHYRIGLLHGRMSAAQKEAVMASYHNHELDILVSTTVIEVGVDVPNATVMVIYDADRFGLATLHQLRGRIGRGVKSGTCYLMTPYSKRSEARKRLEALVKSNDGFELAEEDLRLRHEGEILGYRQHGGVHLRLVDLVDDQELAQLAHEDAQEILENDPELRAHGNRAIYYEAQAHFGIYFEEVAPR